MAPSRRKCPGKAASAAAARRDWKVGDLVLAKVKGFPAWPATVSEPEKWGYPADRKKVVVHFFGTEQIAFCNPADVEEFTEEKKMTLLGKRHGKGADFVRAVNEIIVCFEKLKKQDQVSSGNGTEETNITNENNSEESLTKSVKDEAPLVRVKSFCTGATNDLNSLTEAAAAAAAEEFLHDEVMQLEEARSNLRVTETTVSTTYSTRSKTDGTQSRNSVVRGRMSGRRLRSSSRIDASKLQNLMLPVVSNTRSSRHSGTNAVYDRSLRRSKRIMKSSDDSEGYDVDSPAFVSNDSIEENDSEVMTIDSDTPSFNDGSTVESHCKPLGVETFSENNERDAELCDRLDFQTNTVIKKKKRKPNRKRHSEETVVVAKLNLAVSEAEMLRTECVSPSNNEKLTERYAMEDGDEHLPLVKRARVRMGRPSPAGEEEGILVHKDIEILQVPESLVIQSSEPLNCKADDPGEMESVPIEGDPSNISPARNNFVDGEAALSPSNISPAIKPQLWETRKNFVDDEAALPPSKRLHRALEAMSANVAEDSQRASNCPLTVNTPSNGYCSSFAECSGQSMGNKAVIELGSGPVENHSNDDPDLGASEFCLGSNKGMPEINSKTLVVGSDCVKTCSNNSSNPELCKDSVECTEGSDLKCLKMSPLKDPPADLDAGHQLVKSDSTNSDEEVARLDCSAPGFIMSPTNRYKIESSELNEAMEGSGPAILQRNSEFILVEEIVSGSLNSDTGIQIDNVDGEGDETHGVKPSLAKNNQDSQRSEVVKEASSSVSKDSNVMPSVTPVKVLTSGHHQYLFHSNSISDTHLEDRTFSVTQSSSSLTDGPDSVARASPPSSSMCNVSASDNNYLENNSSCSPDAQLHPEKAKLAGKSNSKVEALSSFETIIKSLTRTKESIGRATRIAIECAKFGFATKVVEILAQNLERESNSHKKVDLFFLVDSITQCSRGIKGDGGIYPSSIQALLPRLLLAAAPPGSNSLENHRQCLKVLRVWQERKILPEPIIRHHIRELDALCGSYPTGGSRRPLRNERAFDDPIREMEGMLVDEYGSNSSFQLPGFCMPPMLRDDDGGSDSDGESFEAVTPEHNTENLDGEKTPIPAVEKRSHILEDVDGELEMEDVAPCCEVEITSISNIAGDRTQVSHHQSDNHYGASFASQQPKDVLLKHAPLPRSPPHPHPAHPLPSSGFPHAVLDSVSNGPNSNLYPSSQNFDSNLSGSMAKQSVLPRNKPTTLDSMHRHAHDNRDFEAQVPRGMPDCSNDCSFSDRPTFHLSSRGSNRIPTDSAFSNGLQLRPPHPAPSNQFSYVQDQQIQPRRDIPPPPHPNRFHTRNAENGNFYRDRDRNKFVPRDNIGECWRPPLPSISGPCYRNGARIAHAPMPYSGPPREPSSNNNRWNFPPRPMRQFNPYRPPSEGPIPVASRGSNLWRPR